MLYLYASKNALICHNFEWEEYAPLFNDHLIQNNKTFLFTFKTICKINVKLNFDTHIRGLKNLFIYFDLYVILSVSADVLNLLERGKKIWSTLTITLHHITNIHY